MKRMLLFGILSAAVSGCFTFNQSELPQSQSTALPQSVTNATATVRGFDAMLTEYVPVFGYTTVYVPGHCGRHHVHPGYYETVPAHTYVAQARPNDVFRRRALDHLEKSGYVTQGATPDWVVEVTFSGPFKTGGEASAEAAWILLTAFTCDYEAQSWSAALKVYDNKTGRLVFHNDYTQHYETKVFSPIPLFGIAACDETTGGYAQSWCLTALTDRAMADATAFLAKKIAP